MLPAPPASCAGWWFTQLWRALLRVRPDHLGTWILRYQGSTRVLAQPEGAEPQIEAIAGALQEDTERRCSVSWEWPGDDGMAHASSMSWQPGEHLVRPLEWNHQRQPLRFPGLKQVPVPWPLSVAITVRGWHGQFLELAEIRAEDTARAYMVQWDPPPGVPRLPRTDLPSALSSFECTLKHTEPLLLLAGLSLPWRLDVDRSSWPIWRRLSGSVLLDALGGPTGPCPRHGESCIWPESGQHFSTLTE